MSGVLIFSSDVQCVSLTVCAAIWGRPQYMSALCF